MSMQPAGGAQRPPLPPWGSGLSPPFGPFPSEFRLRTRPPRAKLPSPLQKGSRNRRLWSPLMSPPESRYSEDTDSVFQGLRSRAAARPNPTSSASPSVPTAFPPTGGQHPADGRPTPALPDRHSQPPSAVGEAVQSLLQHDDRQHGGQVRGGLTWAASPSARVSSLPPSLCIYRSVCQRHTPFAQGPGINISTALCPRDPWMDCPPAGRRSLACWAGEVPESCSHLEPSPG